MQLPCVFIGIVIVLHFCDARNLISSNLGSKEYYIRQQANYGVKYELQLKFRDELLIRFHPQTMAPISQANNAGAALKEIESVMQKLEVSLEPLLGRIPDMVLNDLLARARNRSGALQPDLGGIVRVVDFRSVATEAESEAEDTDASHIIQSIDHLWIAANTFDALQAVEYVHLAALGVPPPSKFPPFFPQGQERYAVKCETVTPAPGVTPLFVDQQTYRNSDPGFEADFINDLGANGRGVRLSDCEYAWDFDHEDVYPIHPEQGWTQLNNYIDHGTASVGVTKGVLNNIGITGVARDADIYTYAERTIEGGYNRVRSVTAAIADSGAGDVVLLEMQTTCCGRSQYSPAETDPNVWLASRVGADAGVVVVGAAGNGNENLDSSPYSEYRSRGDSGAIIVGAGIAARSHNKASFSTYGSRLDVHAWGDWSVMTAGYGVCTFTGSHDFNRHYTNSFSGTSSASALTAGAVAALQSWLIQHQGHMADGNVIRDILTRTGVPQGDASRHHIGPHINLRNAVEGLQKGLFSMKH